MPEVVGIRIIDSFYCKVQPLVCRDTPMLHLGSLMAIVCWLMQLQGNACQSHHHQATGCQPSAFACGRGGTFGKE